MDKFGLPGRIKVCIREDYMGNVTISPVSETIAKRVARSNAYDGSSEVFIQQPGIDELLEMLPVQAFYGRGKDRQVNSGAVFLMDSWEFRHMVGGQSD